MKLTFRAAHHQGCGLETQMVLTRFSNDNAYEGYCCACGGVVFGTLFPMIEEGARHEEKEAIGSEGRHEGQDFAASETPRVGRHRKVDAGLCMDDQGE